MDYYSVYNKLVALACGRSLEGYSEEHHIIPKCLGGEDSKENLVRLTAREHFIAHRLLWKMYPLHEGIAFALLLMAGSNGRRSNRSRLYEKLKLLHAENSRKRLTGVTRPPHVVEKMRIAATGRKQPAETVQKRSAKMKGRVHSEEHNRKVSEALKGRKRHFDAEWRKNMSLSRKGKIFSDSHRKNLSKSLKGKKKTPEHVEKIRQSRLANSAKKKAALNGSDAK